MKYKKRIKTGLGIILCLLVLGWGVTHLHIQSVGQYRQSQKQASIKLGLSGNAKKAASGNAIASKQGELLPGASPKQKIQLAEHVSAKKQKSVLQEKNRGTGAKTRSSHKMASSDSDHKKGKTSSSHTATPKAGTASESTPSKDTSSSSSGGNSADTSASSNPSETATEGTSSSKDSDTAVTQAPTISAAEHDKNQISVSMEICCDQLTAIRSHFSESLQKYIPTDGRLLKKCTLKVEEGSSVYAVLSEVCKAKNIALDAEYVPGYSCYYVKGIGCLYEQQAGDMSGWIYKVNGKSPNKGASKVVVSAGDEITWAYTCDGKTS